MKMRDLGIVTINALDANRGRSALTVLGVVIGIAAVIAMTALIGGIKKGMLNQMGATQAQLVTIELGTGDTITRSDVDMYERDLKADCEYIIATNRGDGKATNGQKKYDATNNHQVAVVDLTLYGSLGIVLGNYLHGHLFGLLLFLVGHYVHVAALCAFLHSARRHHD